MLLSYTHTPEIEMIEMVSPASNGPTAGQASTLFHFCLFLNITAKYMLL